MIDIEDVAAVVVTRGDVDLDPVVFPIADAGIPLIKIWDNSRQENLSVYGRYEAIELTEEKAILVVDDDVGLSVAAIEGLLAAYRPRKLVANMPQVYRDRYKDSALVGFGALFDRGLPAKAFKKFRQAEPRTDNEWFLRTCDIIFSMLTPRVLVDLPFKMLPWTRAPNRMYRAAGNTQERLRMIDLCRKVRDGN